MAAPRPIRGERPPSYVSKATLAAELDICESTVDNWVERDFLPKPIRIGGAVRWNWADVVAAMSPATQGEADPFMARIGNVS